MLFKSETLHCTKLMEGCCGADHQGDNRFRYGNWNCISLVCTGKLSSKSENIEIMKKRPFNDEQVQMIIDEFRAKYKGKQNAVKTDKLLFDLVASGKSKISPQTLRDMMGHIRHNDLIAPGFIVSTVSNGYWYTTDKKEQNDFLDQELNRMSNQYGNLQALHARLRYGKGKADQSQQTLFQ